MKPENSDTSHEEMGAEGRELRFLSRLGFQVPCRADELRSAPLADNAQFLREANELSFLDGIRRARIGKMIFSSNCGSGSDRFRGRATTSRKQEEFSSMSVDSHMHCT